MTSPTTIGRLSLYRRILQWLAEEGVKNVFSHELASRGGATAAQVRRDLMAVGYEGNPQRGYSVSGLLAAVETFLDPPDPLRMAIVGVGNLGRAILAFFRDRRPKLRIVAAFERDPSLCGQVVRGCPVNAIDRMETIVREQDIRVAILAVPAAEVQQVADTLVHAGIHGLVNFAPTPIRAPKGIAVEDMDITATIEKVAYMARGGV